jgi:hypothetical protein
LPAPRCSRPSPYRCLTIPLARKFGETFGSGSGIAIDHKSWRKSGDTLTGTLYLLPDRGYNVEGTTDYAPRLNKISVTFNPKAASGENVSASLAETIKFTDAGGAP